MRIADVTRALPMRIVREGSIQADGDALPGLSSGQVLVFVTFTDSTSGADLAHAIEALSPAERTHCTAFAFNRDRLMFATARALLRRLVGHYAQIPAELVEFRFSEFGKPYLPSAPGLTFNVTHSHGCVVVAIARDLLVGVDVESIVESRNGVVEIAAEVCSGAELAWISRAPAQRRTGRFLDLWTLKEAYVKAIGAGLSKPLRECNFTFADSGAVSFIDSALDAAACKAWYFAQYLPRGTHRLAVATPCKPAGLSLWQLDAGEWPQGVIPINAVHRQ